MDDQFLPVLIWVAFFVALLAFCLRRRDCPDCGRPLSGIQSPLRKTWRQWVEAGYLCRTCGCETNRAGEKVAPGTGPRPGAGIRGVLLVTLPAVAGAVLLFFILSPSTPVAPLPPAAPPPLVAPPA